MYIAAPSGSGATLDAVLQTRAVAMAVLVDETVDLEDDEAVWFQVMANSDPSRDLYWHEDAVGINGQPKTSADGRNGEPVRPWPPIIDPPTPGTHP